MMRATENLFLKIYFSNKKIEVTPYLMESMVYDWFDSAEVDLRYLMNPKTLSEYQDFIDKLEKETPLLVELR
jgi:hypothetical protein